MGNSAENRVNLLAKNWVQVNSHIYKNTITEELIDSYELQAHSQEELAYYNSLLIKRAAINHSNVLKLIYFYQEQQTMVMCNIKKYIYKIYTEHSSGTLSSLIGVDRNEGDLCHCCSVMSGIGCLVEKYGYFGVSPTMIFMVNSVGLSKVDQKQTPKVWINEDLRINHSEQVCNQEQMCFHLYQLFKLLVQRNLCSKIDTKEMSEQKRFKDFFQFIFIAHKKQPSERKAERKRVTSQLNGFEANKLQKNGVTTQPTTKANYLNIKHNNTFLSNNSSRQSLMRVVNCGFNNAEIESTKIGKNSQQETSQQTLFIKKDGAVKEVDLMNKSFQKVEKNKVNFSYTDSLATPKNNKSYKEVKTAKILQSPHQELASVYFRSNQNQAQAQKISPNREILPIISFFNSNPKQQLAVFTQQINQSPEFNFKKSELQNQRKSKHSEELKLCQQQKLLEKPFEIAHWTTLQKNQTAQSAVREVVSEAKVKKQNKLKLQKCIELQCVAPILDSSKKSAESQKHKSMNGFQIAKEYCLSIEPQIKVPSIKINESEEFISESIEISSSRNFSNPREKIDNLTANFYSENEMQRKKSVQSENYNMFSNSYVHPHSLIEDSSRKGSLPIHQQNLDKKYSIYMHTLEDFSKGITNSIKSDGTKRSFPEDSYEAQMFNQNELRAANINYREYFGNNMAVYQKKREVRNYRSSDIDSYYSENESLQERKKVQILQKISNTEKILQQNKKKLQKLQLQKDLQIEKDMIKKEMESLLKNNMMVDESHRIKEKVKHKKATFAELKAEAAKILNDLNL